MAFPITITEAEDDDLISELLDSNPSFRALVAKSKASPRKPFPLSPDAAQGAVPEPQK